MNLQSARCQILTSAPNASRSRENTPTLIRLLEMLALCFGKLIESDYVLLDFEVS